MNYAAEVKIRAERMLGEMLQQTPDSKPGPKKLGSGQEPNSSPSLEEIGIDKKTSMRSQQLASVPVAKFEHAIAEQKEQGKELSTAGTIARIAPKQTPLKVTIDTAERRQLARAR